MSVLSFEPLSPIRVRGAVPAQCYPRKEGPSSAVCPVLAHGWRPALVTFSKSRKNLLRIMAMVLNLPPYIRDWDLPLEHFSLNTFSTYQLKWLCVSFTYTMKLERLSLVSGGGTQRLVSPVQQFCSGKATSAGDTDFPADHRLAGSCSPVPALRQ